MQAGWARSQGAAFISISCALFGCQRVSTLAIFPDAGPNDLVIAAVQRPGGDLGQIESFLAADEPPVLFRNSQDSLHFFAIAEGDLTTIEGLRAYAVGERPEGYGACGRCSGASHSAPQAIHDGDECAVPRFAAYEGDDRAAIEARLRIGFEGPCACAPLVEDPAAAPPVLDLLVRGEDSWPHDSIAVTASGAVALFGEHHSIAIARNGERTVREGADLPFAGRVFAAAGTPAGTFFTLSWEGPNRKIKVLDEELAFAADLDLGVVGANLVPFREGLVMVVGEQPGQEPVALLCHDDVPFDCWSLWSGPFLQVGRTLVDAERMPDGSLVLVGFNGFVLVDHLPLDPSDRPAVRVLGTEFTNPLLDEGVPSSLGHAGQWLLLCVQHSKDARLLAARIDRSSVTAPEPPVFRELYRGGSVCRRFSSVPGEPNAARMVLALGQTVVIDASDPDAPIARDAAPTYVPLGAGETVNGMETHDDGATVAWTGFEGRSKIWLREGEALRLLYGVDEPPIAPISELVVAGDRVIAVRSTAPSDVLYEDRVESIDFEGPRGSILRAAYDSLRNELLLAGADASGGWLGRAALEGGTIEVMRPEGLGAVRRIAEIDPGRFVMSTEDERMFSLEEDRLEPIDLDWDDPTTDGIEREVDPICGERLTDLAVAAGRAHAAGCGGTLFEIDAAALASAHRIAIPPLIGDGPTPDFTSVSAICADDVLLATPAVEDNEGERGRTFELGPYPEDCAEPRLGRCLIRADRGGAVSRAHSGRPVAMAFDGLQALTLFHSGAVGGGSAQRVGTDGRYRFPEAFVLVAAAPWGGFVVASSAGQVLVSR
jgi:hypothetical protein